MPDYNKGKIYVIRSKHTDKVYVGSTTKRWLSDRMSHHRYCFRQKNSGTSSKEILQYDDAYIELLELFPCSTKQELFKRENIWIIKLNSVNKQSATGFDRNTYYKKNKHKWNRYNQELRGKRKKNPNRKKVDAKYAREYQRELNKHRYICECNKSVVWTGRIRHFKTKYHRRNIHNILNHL
jgi:hypothetical protein